ncbi:MAG: family 43 glycosylhydrolase [Prolixibacteraceae bacterium]
MKRIATLITIILISLQHLLAQNPICPPGVYIADPSAKVFNGTLYLYGSTDESCEHWCSWHHDVISTSDMLHWEFTNKVMHSKGVNDEVPYSDNLLFAPDCAFANDSFYLYYCQPEKDFAEGVAVSHNPTGPFTNGTAINTYGNSQIDPSCFIDDDGTAYYIWGQFSLKMAKLKPNMREIDETTLQKDLITEKEHFFHEGAFMTKRNGLYYLVYADISREDKPTCLGYATSSSPFGPYQYGGVIVDNEGCNPNNWNNHGSIAEFKGQWYVFYHRSTHACGVMRKACVEKIEFNTDGSIPEVPMTSQGAADPFIATKEIDAARACLLQGDLFIQAENEKNEILTHIKNDDKGIFKFINFGAGVKSATIRVRAIKGGTINLTADKPWQLHLGKVNVEPTSNPSEWKEVTFDVNQQISGVHALWMQMWGDGENLMEIDWIRFNN